MTTTATPSLSQQFRPDSVYTYNFCVSNRLLPDAVLQLWNTFYPYQSQLRGNVILSLVNQVVLPDLGPGYLRGTVLPPTALTAPRSKASSFPAREKRKPTPKRTDGIVAAAQRKGPLTIGQSYAWRKTLSYDLSYLGVGHLSCFIKTVTTEMRPMKDWADHVLRSRYVDKHRTPKSILDYLDACEKVFIELPDGSWYVKTDGEYIIMPPLPDRTMEHEGMLYVHDLLSKNYIGPVVFDGDIALTPQGTPANPETKKQRDFDSIESAGLVCGDEIEANFSIKKRLNGSLRSDDEYRAVRGRVSNPPCVLCGQKEYHLQLCASIDNAPARKAAGKIHDQQLRDGVGGRILKALEAIGSLNKKISAALNRLVGKDSSGVWRCHGNISEWTTDTSRLPSDALIKLAPWGTWELKFGDDEQFELPSAEIPASVLGVGMGYIARIFQMGGLAIPSGLLEDNSTRRELGARPPHLQLFVGANSHRFIDCRRDEEVSELDCVTKQILRASVIEAEKNGERLNYFEITHRIDPGSPLEPHIGRGFVGLTVEGLLGIRHLLDLKIASLHMSGEPKAHVRVLRATVNAGANYVKNYSRLTGEIERESRDSHERVAKAIQHQITKLEEVGERRLAEYLRAHIISPHGSRCWIHNGPAPLVWRVEGLPKLLWGSRPTKDLMQLAQDRMLFKMRQLEDRQDRISTARRRLKSVKR